MSKEQATEKWVVEVRRAHAVEHRPGNWCCVAQCDDGQTAITVADALQNFMRTGLIGDDFHTRTRLVGEGEEKADDLSDYRRLSGSVKKLKESVDAQRAEVNQAVKKMDQTLYEMRNLVDRVEELYNSAKDETHSAEQAALNGVNKAQEKAQEITLRNIDEATQRSKKAIDTMVLESKRRIERLAMVTLPDRMFHFLKWTALMLVLFILVHIVWQMFS